jgi:hypothetical protein
MGISYVILVHVPHGNKVYVVPWKIIGSHCKRKTFFYALSRFFFLLVTDLLVCTHVLDNVNKVGTNDQIIPIKLCTILEILILMQHIV